MIEIIPNWHPIFVHFTVALFSVSTGLYVLSLLIPDGKLKEQWRTVARWNLWFGMGLTVITVLSGIYAYNTVAHDTPSHLAMSDHRNWALATAALFAAATFWSVLSYRAGKKATAIFTALMLIAAGMLGSTAWRGGELVYRYGLGVMSLPSNSTAAPTASTEPVPSTGKTEPHDHHDDSTPHTH